MKIQESALVIFFVLPLLAQSPEPAQAPAPAAAAEPDAAAAAEYTGPAVLSRGGAASLRASTESIRLRPFVTIQGAYDTGLTPVSVSSTGEIPNVASIGGEAEFGVLGFHRWKKASLGLDYRGSYHHYSKNTYFNSTDQMLSMIYKVKATRRTMLTLRESAGIYSRSFYSGEAGLLIDPIFANTPNNDIFDGRTQYLSTLGDLTFQKSARLSFNIGGDGFLVRRRSSALYGVTGYRARGDVAYRTSRFATSGVAYDFSHFEYTKGFGASDIHVVALNQSFRIGRSWEFAMKIGGARVETLGLARVAVDPVITAITGQTQTVNALYLVNWVPSGELSLTRAFRRSSMNLHYSRGVTPGNGVYLTSRQETASADYSYTGIRKWNLGLSASHTTYGSLTQTLGAFTSYSGGAGATYSLSGSFHIVSRYDYRYNDIAQSRFQRDSHRVSLGFGFSPGDVPLALW